MTTVSGTFTATGVSSNLRLTAAGENVAISISNTWVGTVRLERALTPDLTAWEVVRYWTSNPAVRPSYITRSKNETLRLRAFAYTSGTVTYSFSDGAKVIQVFEDNEGNELFRVTQAGIVFAGDLTVEGAVVAEATLQVDGASTLTGAVAAGNTLGVTGTITAEGALQANTTLGVVGVASFTDVGAAIPNTQNAGTSAATSVKEYGDGFNHVTVLTATALATPAIIEGGKDATGDLIYTFPAGAIILEAAYMSVALLLDGTDQDAIVADVGLGATIATGSIASLKKDAAFENILAGQGILCDGVAAVTTAKEATHGGPMYIASGDDHTVHLNLAATWASQSDGDGTGAYTGTICLIWKFLE